jgi:hypothetical protein
MDLELFYADFMNDVQLRIASSGGFTDHAFAEVAAGHLEDANEITNFEPCHYRAPNGRIAIDGYAFDDADDSLRVFIVHRAGTDVLSTLTKTDAEAQFRKLAAFVNGAFTGKIERSVDDNHAARDFAERAFENRAKISRIRAYLISDCVLSTRVKDWPEGTIAGVPVDYHIWDMGRFFRAASSGTGLDDVTVDFREGKYGDPAGLPCLAASTPGSPYEAYLCVLPADLLGDIYDRYGSRLLEGNVRAFLTAKGKINQGIKNTLIKRPQMFFAYNNGISAVASEVQIANGASGPRIVSATNLQIVNGGQTTASIDNVQRNERQANVTSAFVPMKLSVVVGDESSQMVEDISRYANSQNKVSDADFFGNHPFHRRLEQISRRVWAPAKGGNQYLTRWYYERARGQYLNEFAKLTPAQRGHLKLESPKDQLITKTDLARCELSWQCRPYNVSAGSQIVIAEFAKRIAEGWKTDPDAFNEEYFRRTVARMIIYRGLEKLVSSQPWYVVGYRSIIVTYAIARFANELAVKHHADVDLKLVWRQQAMYPELSSELIGIAQTIFCALYEPAEGQRNLTQWAKRQSCWEEVKKIKIDLSDAFLATLVESADAKEDERAARALQHMDSGIDDQAFVLSLGPQYWQQLLDWTAGREGIAPTDERSLRAAAGQYGSLPTERQCKRLLQLKRRCEDDGFIAPEAATA